MTLHVINEEYIINYSHINFINYYLLEGHHEN